VTRKVSKTLSSTWGRKVKRQIRLGASASLSSSVPIQDLTKLVNFWTIFGTETGANFGTKKSQAARFSSIDKLISVCY